MNSDRPDSNPEPAQFALECCSTPMPQVEQSVRIPYLSWKTPANLDYLVMLTAQIDRLDVISRAAVSDGDAFIDVRGITPARKPSGCWYCKELDRWLPNEWAFDVQPKRRRKRRLLVVSDSSHG